MKKNNFWCKYFIVFSTFFKFHLLIFSLRLKDICSVSVDFCLHLLTYFPNLECTSRDCLQHGRFPSSNMDLLSRKRRVIRAQVPTVPARKVDLVLTPMANVFFRVDHLYTFFVHGLLTSMGKCQRARLVVEKEELTMIDNSSSVSQPPKSWEVRLKRVRLSSLKYKAETKYSRVQNPSTFGWQEVKIFVRLEIL